MEYTSDGRLKYSTGEKVLPSNWNGLRVTSDKQNTNIILNKIENLIKELRLDAKVSGKSITVKSLRAALDRSLGWTEGVSFYEAVDLIITERENGSTLTPGGKRFSWHTIKGYRHTRDNLFRFDPKMTFEGITLNTYEKLIAYFNKHNDHSLNTLGKIIKNWKVFMQAAYRKGLHTNRVFEDPEFRVPAEETLDIYLSEGELKKIYNHNFPSKTLDHARDLFIIDCYTGLRISDIQLLNKENLVDGFIRLANEKTGVTVIIPVHPYIKAIIKKWKGLPPKITDQKLNIYLKDIAQLAGIKGTVLYSVTKGGKRKTENIPRWQMVSNHTARRSFITNLLKAGVSLTDVMRLAGIKKLTTVQKYYKETTQEVADKMKGHKFFKS